MCSPVIFTTLGASTASAATYAMISNVALTVGTGAMNVMAARQEQKIAKARFNAEQRQLDYEQQQLKIEQMQKENDRKEEYFQTVATNRALMGAMGLTGEGGSYKALARKNVNVFKDDLNVIRSQFGAANVDIANRRTDSAMTYKAAKSSAKLKMFTSIFQTATGVGNITSNMKTTPKNDALGFRGVRAGGGNAGPVDLGDLYTTQGYNPYKLNK